MQTWTKSECNTDQSFEIKLSLQKIKLGIIRVYGKFKEN